jgi:hypothetical protein
VVTAPYWLIADAEVLAAQLAELEAWVNTMLRVEYSAYCAPALRDYWAAHNEAVWVSMATLQAAWKLAYAGPETNLEEALRWHDRFFPGVLTRLQRVLDQCIGAQGCRRV